MKNFMKNSSVIIFSLVFFAIISLYFENLFEPYAQNIIMLCTFNIVLAVSLNLVNGFTGQFSIGHAGFMAVGAYTAAYLSLNFKGYLGADFSGEGWGAFALQIEFLINTIAGGVFAAAIGYLVGLPSLKLKGDYLAIVTLGFGEIIRVVILNMNSIGGARGLPGIPKVTSFFWGASWALVTCVVVWRLIRSTHGRAFLAVREDEIAAESVGINTTNAKTRAFVLSSFFAGVAGSLFGHYLSFLSPATFSFMKSIDFVVMVVLGGMGSISGSVFAAILLTILPEALRPLQEITKLDFRMVIYSLLLVVLMLTRPQGLFGKNEIFDFFNRKKS